MDNKFLYCILSKCDINFDTIFILYSFNYEFYNKKLYINL